MCINLTILSYFLVTFPTKIALVVTISAFNPAFLASYTGFDLHTLITALPPFLLPFTTILPPF